MRYGYTLAKAAFRPRVKAASGRPAPVFGLVRREPRRFRRRATGAMIAARVICSILRASRVAEARRWLPAWPLEAQAMRVEDARRLP